MLNGLHAFQVEGKWYKGNLHSHTTRSDGRMEPEARIEQYAELRYDFIAITDHTRLSPELEREDSSFVVLSGVELHPPIPGTGADYHLLLPRVSGDFPVELATRSLKVALDEMSRRRILFFIGHPYWCGHELDELLMVAPTAAGLEVYNTTTARIGRALSAVHWDSLLTRGFPLSGIAVDDCHREDLDVLGGWIMLKAGELSAPAIMEALTAGHFYASSGPVIEKFSFQDGVLGLKTEPVRTINFVATASQGSAVWAESGKTVTEAQWQLPQDFTGYVRGECYIDHRHAAWTNPVFFDQGKPIS